MRSAALGLALPIFASVVATASAQNEIPSEAPSPTQSQTPHPAPTWRHIERVDPQTRQPITELTTPSSNTYLSPTGQPHQAFLHLRCTGRYTPDATVSTPDDILPSHGSLPDLRVSLDYAPATRQSWANFPPHSILIYDLAPLLGAHRRLTIILPVADPEDAVSYQTVTFDLSVLADAQQAASCRRRLR